MDYCNNRFWIFGLIIYNLIGFIKCENHNVHELMNQNELGYYFNTNNLKNIPEYDVVHLKSNYLRREIRSIAESGSASANKIHSLKFNAFDRSIYLRLKPNENLISNNLKIWIHDENQRKKLFSNNTRELFKNCYFLHNDKSIVAGLNNCENGKYNGIILMPNATFEIQPLNTRLQTAVQKLKNISESFEFTHIIKRVNPPEINPHISRLKRSVDTFLQNVTNNNFIRGRAIKKNNVFITLELGVFFDEAAYNLFAPLFNYDAREISEMLLAYMNGVQALYHHNSLGTPVDVTIVHLEIMRRQPQSLEHFNGERDQLLDSFCAYQQRLNPPEDNDPDHWDMGLYLSGLDFYTYDNGVNNGATMGLATVRGVCSGKYACVIVEFGATNAFGRPYPSAGFNSIYIAAHEIGHNLGMSHDSSGNSCTKEGYIMSPSRGTQGETSWSSCSADIIRTITSWATCLNDKPRRTPVGYDAWRYNGVPGQKWSAKRQCEILLTDIDAMPSQNSNNQNICQNLECRTPHRSGFFFAGPALEGTDCGVNNWCEGGNCVFKAQSQGFNDNVVVGGMGPWKKEKCVSGCLEKSKGAIGRHRECNNPLPINTVEGCDLPTFDKVLCNDNRICQNVRRKSAIQFASRKCKQFSQKISDLDPKGVGLQAPHENHRLWMGCAIFCRRKGGSFYSPRMNLNDIGQDAYFPDGTWCHSTNSENYYCLQHHCLPEGFQFNKNSFWLLSEDVPISGNAYPNPIQSYNKKLIDYLSVDENGKALRSHLSPEDVREQRENEQWVDDIDFRIVPSLLY